MRSSRLLVHSDDFTIHMVTCDGDHAGWSAAEPTVGHGIVLVRSGLFRVRGSGGELLADPTMAYLHGPGAEARFAHPNGGDVCTALSFAADIMDRSAPPGAPGAVRGWAPVPVDARLELAHLRLLSAAGGDGPQTGRARTAGRAGATGHAGATGRTAETGRAVAGDVRSGGVDTGFEVAERLVRLLGRASGAATAAPVGARAGARLAVAAREAVLADAPDASGLFPLARRLGVSPYHLSRTFTVHTGLSLTRYRNRVRVSRALHRLRDGERDLARLAADLGFADQAHLGRTVKHHLGHTPGALRRLLQEAAPDGDGLGGDGRDG